MASQEARCLSGLTRGDHLVTMNKQCNIIADIHALVMMMINCNHCLGQPYFAMFNYVTTPHMTIHMYIVFMM